MPRSRTRPRPPPPEVSRSAKPASSEPRLREHTGLEAILFFIAVSLIYIASPIILSGDSHFVLPTALTIVRHGHANVDQYSAQFHEAPWALQQANGHYWNSYPPGVPFLVVPLAWVADRIDAVFGVDLEAKAIHKAPLHLELIFASLITAAASALLFVYIRDRLPLPQSLLLGFLFALGTVAYSNASRGLFQHGPSMLLLMGALVLYDRLAKWGHLAAVLLGFCAGYSYAVRPANLIIAPAFLALVALTHRRFLPAYVIGALAGVLPLFAFNLAALGTWSSGYYRITQGSIRSLSIPLGPLYGVLFSPSRGLFVFSPFLLFVFARLLPGYRRRYGFQPVEILLLGLSVAWWVGTARWPMWWGGGSYGPRLMCEAGPCLTILLIPVVARLSLNWSRATTALTTSFALAGMLSVAINLRGATAPVAGGWNQTPVNVDVDPDRVWSWSDPQFLRGL